MAGGPGGPAQGPPPGPAFPPVDTPPTQQGGAVSGGDVHPIQEDATPLLQAAGLIEDASQIVVTETPTAIVAQITEWKDSGKVKAALQQLATNGRHVQVKVVKQGA